MKQCFGGRGVTRQLEQAHQPEDPQEAQVQHHRQKMLQQERQDRQQIDDVGAGFGMREARRKILFVSGIFRCAVQARQVLDSEDAEGQHIDHEELQRQHRVHRLHRL